MSKTSLQEKIDNYIQHDEIHLRCYALFNQKFFEDMETRENEIRNGKIILTNSVGKFLMQKNRIVKYITELPEIVDGQKMTKLDFNCYVFSGTQLRQFIEIVKHHKVLRLIH